ncbi:MAG: PilW family protein [Desulfobacterales bacterium]|nr:PilW family protein [Desulfobacterales bacterium]
MNRNKNDNFDRHRSAAGFTLIEVLIVMAISGLVLTGVYSVFNAQQRAHAINTQLVQMHQNLRAALAIMERDIRMAGYSPSGNADVGFAAAREGFMQLTMDLNDDGDAGDGAIANAGEEDVTYGFQAAEDANRDGRLDDPDAVAHLRRDWGGGMQPMARNIKAVYFAYAFDDDQDGDIDRHGPNLDDPPIWAVDSNGDGTLDLDVDNNAALGSPVDLDRIRAVRIWLLARSEKAVPRYSDDRNYEFPRWTIAGNGDPFMHRLSVTTVKCRNMIF